MKIDRSKRSINKIQRKLTQKQLNGKRKRRYVKKEVKTRLASTLEIEKAKSYVKNLSNTELSNQELLLLSKNLKFVPTPEPPKIRDIMDDFNSLAGRMRTKLWMAENKINPKHEPFTNKRVRPEKLSDNVVLENYITATQIEIANMQQAKSKNREEKLKQAVVNLKKNKQFKRKAKSNLSRKLRKTLITLKRNKEIIIKKSDKGNSTVVIDKEQYIKEGERQLNSCAHYTEIERDITPEIVDEVRSVLQEMLREGEITQKNYEYLCPSEELAKTAELYLLNKIHSDPPTKARPIISANSCPVERISEFIDFFLQPIVTEQNTYLKDTSDLIRKIEMLKVPDNALIITLDYESMYTNIVHAEAYQAVKRTIELDLKHKLINGVKRPSDKYFCKLLELAIARNTFKFNGKNYYQCRGVAMGHRASPSVSDIVIFYLEEKFFKFSKGQVLKWLRFRDDVTALFNGTRAEAISFLDKANEIHNTLKFKYQISEKEGIFLDTVIFKGPRFKRENVLDFKPYVKPTEAFQYIHRTSSHPESVFTGLIKGELTRFVRTATNYENYLERANLFQEKLLLRGYSAHEFQRAFSQVDHRKRDEYLKEKNKTCSSHPLVFVTPFNPHVVNLRKALIANWNIIEESSHLKTIFNEKPLMAFKRGPNLRDSLVRARLSGKTEADELDNLIKLLKNDPDSGLQQDHFLN